MAFFDLNPTFTALKTPFYSSYGVVSGLLWRWPWIDYGLTVDDCGGLWRWPWCWTHIDHGLIVVWHKLKMVLKTKWAWNLQLFCFISLKVETYHNAKLIAGRRSNNFMLARVQYANFIKTYDQLPRLNPYMRKDCWSSSIDDRFIRPNENAINRRHRRLA